MWEKMRVWTGSKGVSRKVFLMKGVVTNFLLNFIKINKLTSILAENIYRIFSLVSRSPKSFYGNESEEILVIINSLYSNCVQQKFMPCASIIPAGPLWWWRPLLSPVKVYKNSHQDEAGLSVNSEVLSVEICVDRHKHPLRQHLFLGGEWWLFQNNARLYWHTSTWKR